MGVLKQPSPEGADMNIELELDVLRMRVQELEGKALAQRLLLELLYAHVFNGNEPGLAGTLNLVEAAIANPAPAEVLEREHTTEVAARANAHLKRFMASLPKRMQPSLRDPSSI
jgi:hypothetical protein